MLVLLFYHKSYVGAVVNTVDLRLIRNFHPNALYLFLSILYEVVDLFQTTYGPSINYRYIL